MKTFTFRGTELIVHDPAGLGLSHWICKRTGKPRCNLMGVGFNTRTMRWSAHIKWKKGRLMHVGDFVHWEEAAGRVLGIMGYLRIGYYRPKWAPGTRATRDDGVYHLPHLGEDVWSCDVWMPRSKVQGLPEGEYAPLNLGLYIGDVAATEAVVEGRRCYRVGEFASGSYEDRAMERARLKAARNAEMPVYDVAEDGSIVLVKARALEGPPGN